MRTRKARVLISVSDGQGVCHIETQRLKGVVGEDGILRLEVPIGIPNKEVEVIVVYERPAMTQEEWRAFLDQTAGSLADDPIEHGDQGMIAVHNKAV